MTDDIYKKLTDIFHNVFEDDEIIINSNSTADDIEKWDSFTHMNLILMIEVEFDIEFSQQEAMGFQNVGDMANCIASKVQHN